MAFFTYKKAIDGFRSIKKSNQTHSYGRHLGGQAIKEIYKENQEKLFLFLGLFATL